MRRQIIQIVAGINNAKYRVAEKKKDIRTAVVEEVPARQEKRDHLFIWAAAPALAIMTRIKN
jgi:hypothetical protein